MEPPHKKIVFNNRLRCWQRVRHVATCWTLLERHRNLTSRLPDGFNNTSYLSETIRHACCCADGVLTYVQQVFHCGYICAYVSTTNHLFLYPHLITWVEIQINLYYKVMMHTKARVPDVPSSACPAVGVPWSKRWPQTCCCAVCPSCQPTDLVSFPWIDECRVLVCSGALLHKKIIMRRWSCCCCCCCRREQLLLCVKNKLVFMTDARWLSYLINIHAWSDLKQPYLHLLTLGLLTQRNYIFISYTQN